VTRRRGTVLGRDGAAFRVLAGSDELRAVLRGRMKQRGLKVVAGDIVSLEPEAGGELWGIIEVEPRHSVLERRIPGGRGTRAIVANVDRIFVVTASREPAPVPSVIDRLLVLAEANDVTPALIVNKIDLDPGTDLIARYLAAGYQVFPVSTKRGQGLEAISGWLPDHSSVFTGPSGAGKSSLLNALEPGIALRTAAVSDKIGRGMHTTVSAVMIPLSGGGWLVDTPGFSEVGLWGLEARGLAECFPEMRSRLGTCRFQDCRHVSEPGCAIRAAVTEGAIHPDRYASYLLLLEETEEEPRDWE
jgi:ribosome biogenesis GTPase